MYKERIIDQVLNDVTSVFNAVNIVGPKGCGKTTTAKQRAKTIIEFQNEEERDCHLLLATGITFRIKYWKSQVLYYRRFQY